MYLRWLLLALVAAALVGGVIAACGGDNTSTCTTDSNCSGGQLCHPTARQCVKICSSSSDCPSNQNSCTTFTGIGADGGVVTTQKICQCTDDNMCAGGSTTGSTSICNNVDKICQTKCGSNSNCASVRICNTSTGQCGGGTCTRQGTCTSGSGTICNFGNGNCEAPKSCVGSNPNQPDTCSYGQYCPPDLTICQEVPKPGSSGSCPNFVSSPHGLAWGTGSTGPIIYSVTKFSLGTDTVFCGAISTVRVKVHVKAYSTSPFSTSTSSFESSLHLVTPDGREITGGAIGTTQDVTFTNSNRNVEFNVNYCTPSGTTSYSAGMHFIAPGGGNEYCALIQ